MSKTSQKVTELFEAFERAIGGSDPDFLGRAYAETFMFGGPGGVQSVKRDDFLKAIPKRAAFFEATGLKSTTLGPLEETRLDEHYRMVHATWIMRFEKDPESPIISETAASYVLYERDGSLQIVFQLDHQDLGQRVQELGLMPASS